MERYCKQCNKTFLISEFDRDFYERVSPVFDGRSFAVPAPSHCPDCRQVRRLVWRNERSLYKRCCGLCEKNILTVFSGDKPFVVYCNECWWGDKWEALDYGCDFDFSRGFFEQFAELMEKVPRPAVSSVLVGDNCEYTNYMNEAQHCYLSFGSGFADHCQYIDWVYYAKNSLDCSFCKQSELDYMNVDCSGTYHCCNCLDCHNCSDLIYCFDCRGSRNCAFSLGLRNKEYCFLNEQLTKGEYEERIQNVNLSEVLGRLALLKKEYPHLNLRMINCENCTGDDLEDCKNCHFCFGIKDMEDCRYCYDAFESRDCMDANRMALNELVYEYCSGGYNNRTLFSVMISESNNCYYSWDCHGSNDVFASVGLHRKENVILNKKYSRKEYEELVSRIIEHMQATGEWGEFFHQRIAPFAYNETIANDFFPSLKEEVNRNGYKWRPKDDREYVPAHDDVLACSVSGRNFRLTDWEKSFYEKEGLELPLYCPDERYRRRLTLKNPRRLIERTCTKCAAKMKSVFTEKEAFKVYCEGCYLKGLY